MKTINIVIDDDNYYFATGLRLCIEKYAQLNNKTICFFGPGDVGRPDMVFASSRWRRANIGRNMPVIAIKNVAARDKMRVLCRKDSQSQLFELLAEVLSDAECSASIKRQPLTIRERQVVSYLRCGFDQSQTARLLGVSVKTVHSHKRSVMSKLMLHRNHDFIYWLLSQNGEYS
ncbi:helix-turn-helix transcriptional regulator [Serratia marcescens]|uniref:helix-turn-helix transcriptional regulator n=1 Tax=Serratia marcescens TaxID=615 RepID=UPI001A237445|nr:helix-turn-helix transcriptional regulator [Serratia marcescens]HAT5020731.1 helix-turn-helix transcriptional regulator [Serratia marcescens]